MNSYGYKTRENFGDDCKCCNGGKCKCGGDSCDNAFRYKTRENFGDDCSKCVEKGCDCTKSGVCLCGDAFRYKTREMFVTPTRCGPSDSDNDCLPAVPPNCPGTHTDDKYKCSGPGQVAGWQTMDDNYNMGSYGECGSSYGDDPDTCFVRNN